VELVDGVALPSPIGRVARVAPIAACVAVGAAGLLVRDIDPAAPGSHFPSCAFHSATGLWCPGCGLTRGVHALLNGDVGAAFASNIFTPIAIIAIVWLLISWTRLAWGRPAPRLPHGAERWLMFGGPAVVFAYGLLRNLPLAPMRSLAP
jgi:hypothetical protein